MNPDVTAAQVKANAEMMRKTLGAQSQDDYIEPFINFYITAGYLSPEDLLGSWEYRTQALLRVNKLLTRSLGDAK